jgi:tellurite resistance protein
VPRAPHRWVFSLERAASVQTDAKRGMSSATCPNCGAPTGESTAPSCEFCATPLGTSDREWVLARAQPWETFLAGAPPATRAAPAAAPDRQERQRLLYAMAQLAAIDGVVSDAERARLDTCAVRWGLEPKDVTVALSSQSKAAGPAEPLAKGSAEARAFLEELVALARVDGRVDANEKKMLTLVAGHLGLELGEFLRR